MRVFGLTGGIASGKTTVARRIEERGVPVVYADQLARDAVAKGSDGLAAIVATFGDDVLLPNGELDRRALGARTFGDKAMLAKLNAIVHPRVGALALEAFSALATKGHALVCYEVPLLVENGLADMFRPVVVVAASHARQLERTLRRDNLSEEEARARIASQRPLEEKVAVADFVIENDGTLEQLLERTDEVLAAVRGWGRAP
ncbi:MAG: dephospho-CoA kinase [Polyangiaceae bacterium]|nr:dephospho-CoA kinase [Polyangiaceae bacterium]